MNVRASHRRPESLTNVHLAPVPRPDRPHYLRRDVAEAARGTMSGRAWRRSGPELALLEVRDGQIQQHGQDLREVAGGDLVAEQLLGVAQLVVRRLIDRALQGEPPGRQRLHREPILPIQSRYRRNYPRRG